MSCDEPATTEDTMVRKKGRSLGSCLLCEWHTRFNLSSIMGACDGRHSHILMSTVYSGRLKRSSACMNKKKNLGKELSLYKCGLDKSLGVIECSAYRANFVSFYASQYMEKNLKLL